MATTFSNKCNILGALFTNERENEDFFRFFEFNDIGLPLAYAVSQNLCEVSDKGESWIELTWKDLMEALEITDNEFESLDEVLSLVK